MYFLRRCVLFACAFLLIVNISKAQSHSFKTTSVSNTIETELSNSLSQFQVFELEESKLNAAVKSSNSNQSLKLNLGSSYRWEFELYSNDMFAENASIRVLTENGEYFHPVPRDVSFKGNVKGNPQQEVSLLIHDDYIFGHITDGSQRTYISSVSRYVSDAPKNLYIVFDQEDQISESIGNCGLEEYPQFNLNDSDEHNHDHEEGEERLVTGLCYDVDLGVVSDYSMFTDKGNTVQGVIDHVITVMTDVETDYTTSDIDDALEFEIVEQVVSTCSFCDEWTASTDPSDLLSEFTNWSLSGGFNTTVDMGQFWTDRDFDGTTVGLAYRASGLLCNSAYHVLQDFTANANNLRVMTSHEIGHNLNASHDASGSSDIMAPSVSSSTTWSAASLGSINPVIDDGFTNGCLVSCAATPCDPVTDVSITSVNATGFTITWTATTEGDYRLKVIDEDDFSEIHSVDLSSSGSMVITPTGWEICHRYKVMVENDCGSGVYAAPVSSVVADIDQGCAEFDSDASVAWGSSTVNFTDASTNATSWSWTFGDGNTSTAQNPTNAYASPGVYAVTLTVNAGAHTKTKSNYVFVLPTGVSLPYTLADGGNMEDNDFGTGSLTSGKTSAFEKGVPTNVFTNSSNCWVTDLDGDIPGETNEMALYSPSYDFTNATGATVSFSLGMEFRFCNGPFAAQLQYSTNSGGSWTRLGADTDAGWYNRGPGQSCSISTVVFADEMGWTISSNAGTSYSYNVDALAGNSSVIFRYVFSVSGLFSSGFDRAGMMVDDFEISATLVPVDLTAFDGRLDKEVVKLNWATSSELDNDYFLVEKSLDGQNFEKLMIVEGRGNSFINQDYKVEDENPFVGVNYYRLTQFDFDGNENVINKIVAVEYFGEGEIMVQPNPSQGNEIQLIYQSEKEGEVIIEIFDTAGKQVKTLDVYALKEKNVFDIALGNLSNGIYYIRTIHQNQIQSLRFVKTD